jgi:hypothetical protein
MRQLREERNKMINNALDAKHRGWLNASQHSKWDNVRQLGKERKKMIKDALDAKHQGWLNMSQHDNTPTQQYTNAPTQVMVQF